MGCVFLFMAALRALEDETYSFYEHYLN